MVVNEIRVFNFENYYKQIGFSKTVIVQENIRKDTATILCS